MAAETAVIPRKLNSVGPQSLRQPKPAIVGQLATRVGSDRRDDRTLQSYG